jgi:uncharacterized membrane protein YgcG
MSESGTKRAPLFGIVSIIVFAIIVAWMTLGSATAVGFRIDAGGDADGWERDLVRDVSPYLVEGNVGRGTTSHPIDVSHPSVPNGTDPVVFKNARFDREGGAEMLWRFPVTPGDHDVQLYFSENNPGTQQVGERLFDVTVEGQKVLDDFDVYLEAGGGYRGVVETFRVTADDYIEVLFEHELLNPSIKAIVIVPLDPSDDGGDDGGGDDGGGDDGGGDDGGGDDGGGDDGGGDDGCQGGVAIAGGADIQTKIEANPAGTRFCLSGTYTIDNEIFPKAGNAFVGPATIVPGRSLIEAFDLDRVSGVLIEDLDISGFVERAIKCGPNTTVRKSRLHHNLRNGLGGGNCGGLVLTGNEIDHNGAGDVLGVGAAGVKLAGDSDGTTVTNNDIHDNVGNGLWWDEDARNAWVEGNLLQRNCRKGLMYETGAGPITVVNNVITGNNWCGQAVGGGIGVVSSRNVEIRGNTITGNEQHSIKVWKDSRGYQLDNIRIHDNEVSEPPTGCDLSGVVCQSNS